MRLEIYRSTQRIYVDADGEWVDPQPVQRWRWRIRATNGRILADSGEAYGRLRDCAHGAGLVVGFDLDVIKSGSDFTMGRTTTGSYSCWRITVTP